jgi:hypothetical protein
MLAVSRILWAALFVSTLIYVAVLELMTAQSEGHWQSLLLSFAFAGVGAAAASLFAPRFARGKRSRGATAEPRSSQARGPYLVALILALAFAESVAILGLVLGLLGAPPSFVMPFFFVTWILMLIRFPTQEKLDAFDA